MSARRWSLVLSICAASICGVPVLCPSECRADAADDRAFDEGAAAMNAGNYQRAYDIFKGLWDKKQSLDIAANLSQAEAKLGKKRDAAEHLAFAVSALPATAGPQIKQRMEADLRALEAEVGKVNVQCPSGTVVSLDGKQIGISPIKTVYVEPGPIVIVGRHEQQGEARVELKVDKGGSVTALLILKGPGKPGGRGDDKPIWPTILFASVAGVGAAVGIAGFVLSAQASSSADDTAEELRNNGQTCKDAPDSCVDAQDNLNNVPIFRGMGIAGVSVAGAGLTAMIVYLLLPGSSERTAAGYNLRITPALGLDTQGVFVTGSF